MKLGAKEQMIVAGVLIGLVAVAFIVLLIVPQFGKLSQLDTDMTKAQADIAAANQLLTARQEAKAQAAETQAKLTRLENQIPDAPELAALIIELQDTANDAGVQWDKFSPTKPADMSTGYQRIGITFFLYGRWDDIADYLRRLSELERAVRVLSVDVTPKSNEAESTTGTPKPKELAAQVSLEVYSLPRKAAAPGAPGVPGAAPSAPQ